MWRFAVMLLMVMMLCLMAPMTAMAHVDTGGAPVLAVTMEHWSDIMTVKERAGPKSELAQLREPFNLIDYTTTDTDTMITAQAIDSARGLMDNDINIYMRPRATDGKAGGAAIFASGKPRLSPANSIVI